MVPLPVSAVAPYTSFIAELEQFVRALASERCLQAFPPEYFDLDKQASSRLREDIAIEHLRSTGAFFTNSSLAKEAISPISQDLGRTARILDPACGIGDLLLECASYFPAQETLSSTINLWNRSLLGFDIQGQFAKLARIRLVAAAAYQANKLDIPSGQMTTLFRYIRKGNAFVEKGAWGEATHIIMNPPFTSTSAPPTCKWGQGTVSAAALFIERALTLAKSGTKLIAILPDVLRSGSRYQPWRRMVENCCFIESITRWGKFDQNTDVDVFILRATTGNNHTDQQPEWYPKEKGPTLSSSATVHVGPVVEFRHPQKGPSYPYVTPKTATKWAELNDLPLRRKFTGTIFEPPFLVIRRTSSPSESPRTIATIINCDGPVAVENHLLIIKPLDNSLDTCRTILSTFKHPSTTEWLNKRIRCRHLTVKAVKGLPLRPS